MLVLESCSRSKQSSTFKLYPNKIKVRSNSYSLISQQLLDLAHRPTLIRPWPCLFMYKHTYVIFVNILKEAFDNFAEEAIGIDFDLQEELVARQKWENYSLEVEESEMFGGYRDLVENVEHALHLKRANGTIEMSNSYVCRDDNDGKVVALHFFQGCDGSLDGLSDTISCFKKFTRSCPFSFELLNVFYEGKSLGLVYELNGGAITMAEALQASVTSGGFISSSKDQEETLMEQWIAQLLWTLQLFHIEAGWFIGSGLLFSPQNILLTSQSTKLLINGLGATQILALSRSPLPYTEAEIIDHQTKDLQALAELIKTFLSGPRRWLLRSPLIAPILAYLDQRGTMAFTSLSDLLELPASSNLLQRLLVRSFKYF